MQRSQNASQIMMAQANQDLKNIVAGVKGNIGIVAVEEMGCAGSSNSKVITLQLANASVTETYNLVFGTPLGIANEYEAVPLQTAYPNLMFKGGGLTDLSDNQGIGLKFLQLINKRLVRHACYISHIEVITPANALGNSQKSESVTRFTVPFNSASDTCTSAGNFVPQFTEYTGVTILDGGIVLGEFTGFIYNILPLSTMKLNIHIASIDAPVFGYSK